MATIAEQLQQLNDIKSAIKTAISNRGVAVADTDTFRSYADKIGEIGETVNKTKFGASVDALLGDVDENGVLQAPTEPTVLNFAGVTEIAAYGLYYVFFRRKGITSVDFSSLESVGVDGLSYAFDSCTGITGALDLSSLESVEVEGLRSAFSGCTGITSVDLSSLESVGTNGLSSAFSGCTGITSVNLSSLQSVVGQGGMSGAFNRCGSLTTISFPSLTSVQTSSFGSSYLGMFEFCTNLTEIHFRADMQATIETMTGYSSKFGATNATIYFDL